MTQALTMDRCMAAAARRRGALTALAAVAVACGFLTGCEQQKVTPAMFNLPQGSTLVLVDDRQTTLGNPTYADVVADKLGQELVTHQAARNVIAQQRLGELRQKLGEKYAGTAIDRVGKELGAAQVIYVDVQMASLEPTPGLLRPIASVRVKVIDAANSKRLYPPAEPFQGLPSGGAAAPAEGVLVQTALPLKDLQEPDRAALEAVTQQLLQTIARDVARLFYKHTKAKGEDFGQGLNLE